MYQIDKTSVLEGLGDDQLTAQGLLDRVERAKGGDLKALPFSSTQDGFSSITRFCEQFDGERQHINFGCSDREIDRIAGDLVINAKLDICLVLGDMASVDYDFRDMLSRGLGYEDKKLLAPQDLVQLADMFARYGEDFFKYRDYENSIPLMRMSGFYLPYFTRLQVSETLIPPTHHPEVVYALMPFMPFQVLISVDQEYLDKALELMRRRDSLLEQVSEAARNDQDDLGRELADKHGEACHDFDQAMGEIMKAST